MWETADYRDDRMDLVLIISIQLDGINVCYLMSFTSWSLKALSLILSCFVLLFLSLVSSWRWVLRLYVQRPQLLSCSRYWLFRVLYKRLQPIQQRHGLGLSSSGNTRRYRESGCGRVLIFSLVLEVSVFINFSHPYTFLRFKAWFTLHHHDTVSSPHVTVPNRVVIIITNI